MKLAPFLSCHTFKLGISSDQDGRTTGIDVAFKASFTQSQSVPEPTSVLSLLAVGAMAAGSTLKRKQAQKVEHKGLN